MSKRYIEAYALYEQTAEWEAKALAVVEKLNSKPLEEMDVNELTEWRKWSCILNERTAFKHDVQDAPTADVVERSAYDQVAWERDTAIAQLEEIGKGFGEKMDDVVKAVRCKDCKHWQTVVKNAEYGLCNAWHMLLTTGRDAYCSEARQREESENEK